MRTLQNPFAGPVVYKRKPHTASHKTDRREIAALVVAMLIFFIGLPGHTSNTMVSTQHMAKHLVRLVLVMLGVASPVAPPVATHISSPAATQIASKATAPRSALIHTPAPKKAAVETMSLNSLSTNSFLQRYTYRFDGIAIPSKRYV